MGVKVRQKVKGKGNPWWVFVNHNNQRTSKLVGKKEAADKVAREMEAQIALGTFSFEEEKPVKTFKEYADSWISTTVPATCKPSTASDYERILSKHVNPVFGESKVNQITEGAIKDFLFSKVNAGYRASTVSHMKNVVSGVLTKAKDDKVITVNPTLELGDKFMVKIKGAIQSRNVEANEENGEPDPLSQEELNLFLSTVHRHYREHYPMFLFMARTGVRAGEALGLKWGDIDFNRRFIHLRRSLSWGKITTLKGKRVRDIDMSLQLSEILKDHQIECKKKGLALGLGEAPEYVFTNTKGLFLELHNWRRRVFKKALNKAGIREIRIHDMRHTYATLRISAGHNIADVSAQLGHHSAKFTLDVYNHWMPGKKKDEVDSLDDPQYRNRDEREQVAV
jgi:integrase